MSRGILAALFGVFFFLPVSTSAQPLNLLGVDIGCYERGDAEQIAKIERQSGVMKALEALSAMLSAGACVTVVWPYSDLKGPLQGLVLEISAYPYPSADSEEAVVRFSKGERPARQIMYLPILHH